MVAEVTRQVIPQPPKGEGKFSGKILDLLGGKGRREKRAAYEKYMLEQKQLAEEAQLAEAASPAQISPMSMSALANKTRATDVKDNGYRYGKRPETTDSSTRNPYDFRGRNAARQRQPEAPQGPVNTAGDLVEKYSTNAGLTKGDITNVDGSGAVETSKRGFQKAKQAVVDTRDAVARETFKDVPEVLLP